MFEIKNFLFKVFKPLTNELGSYSDIKIISALLSLSGEDRLEK